MIKLGTLVRCSHYFGVSSLMISAFFTGVVVAIPTSLVAMKLLNSSLFINNSELLDMNQKISIVINQIDEFREERREEREKFLNVSDDTKQVLSD